MYNKISLLTVLAALSLTASAINIQTQISIKQPGNAAKVISLKAEGQKLKAANGEALPLDITHEVGRQRVLSARILVSPQPTFAQGGTSLPHIEELELPRRPSLIAHDECL